MIKLFTHNDLDGIGCAVLAMFVFGKENVDVEYCDYKNINKRVRNFAESAEHPDVERCFITDISIDDELASYIDERYNDGFILLFDHHSTEKVLMLDRYGFCTIVTELDGIPTSGTELFHNYLIYNCFMDVRIDDVLYSFVSSVRDYDTWRWKNLGLYGLKCKYMNDLFKIYGRDAFIDNCLNKLKDENVYGFPYFYDYENSMLLANQNVIDKYIENKNNSMITLALCGNVAGVVFAEQHISELGNKICEMHPEIDFCVIIDMDGTISYRTVKDDIDLGNDIAAKFGGGGHRKAAGSNFDRKFILDAIRNIFSR